MTPVTSASVNSLDIADISQFDQLKRQLEDMAPAGTVVRAERIADIDLANVPTDLILDGSVPKRQREYVAGRIAAKRALGDLGAEPCFPTVGNSREPVWPIGVVGSITHDDIFALTAVCPANRCAAIGIDIEPNSPLNDDVREQILLDTEADSWAAHTENDNFALHLFSYKEALFKCVFPLIREYIEFADVEVLPLYGGLIANYIGKSAHVGPYIANTKGVSRSIDGYVLSVCWVEA